MATDPQSPVVFRAPPVSPSPPRDAPVPDRQQPSPAGDPVPPPAAVPSQGLQWEADRHPVERSLMRSLQGRPKRMIPWEFRASCDRHHCLHDWPRCDPPDLSRGASEGGVPIVDRPLKVVRQLLDYLGFAGASKLAEYAADRFSAAQFDQNVPQEGHRSSFTIEVVHRSSSPEYSVHTLCQDSY